MSAEYAIRGYKVQALVSILEALEDNAGIEKVTFDPSGKADEKVDLKIQYLSGRVVAIQIKSSQNHFTRGKIDSIASELKATAVADEWQLILVGSASHDVIENKETNGVRVIGPYPLDISRLESSCVTKIYGFISAQMKTLTLSHLQLVMLEKSLCMEVVDTITVTRDFTIEDLRGFLKDRIQAFSGKTSQFQQEISEMKEFSEFFDFEADKEMRNAVIDFYFFNAGKFTRRDVAAMHESFVLKPGKGLDVRYSLSMCCKECFCWLAVALLMVSFSIASIEMLLYRNNKVYFGVPVVIGMLLCLPFAPLLRGPGKVRQFRRIAWSYDKEWPTLSKFRRVPAVEWLISRSP